MDLARSESRQALTMNIGVHVASKNMALPDYKDSIRQSVTKKIAKGFKKKKFSVNLGKTEPWLQKELEKKGYRVEVSWGLTTIWLQPGQDCDCKGVMACIAFLTITFLLAWLAVKILN